MLYGVQNSTLFILVYLYMEAKKGKAKLGRKKIEKKYEEKKGREKVYN